MSAPYAVTFSRPPLWQRVRPFLTGFDPWLLMPVLLLAGAGAITVYSAGLDYPGRFEAHVRNMAIAAALMFLVAQVPPAWLARLALPLFLGALVLLMGVELFGQTRKGATRWLSLGVVTIQPSEIMKIALPLMLAWWFQQREGRLRVPDFLIAGMLLAVPVALILRQPDLGTALLVSAAGLYVIFFAGFPLRIIVPLLVAGAAGILALILLESTLCAPEVDWVVLREYQKGRVCTLLDPTKDPLGRGFHIIQSTIAIGSGGLWGKGWLGGTQAHLEFIPERTTDFVFAVYAEEFGLVGNAALLLVFLWLIVRGLLITAFAPTLFSRLVAGSITLTFFTYAFVNMGMVSGILPVVGVPLPFMSYGGTMMVTMGLGLGILLSIHRATRLARKG